MSIPCLRKDNNQLTTLEANRSRLCTKQRWVVEWVNSSLKRFKYLKRTVTTVQVPHLYEDVRIAAALHNSFFSRQCSDGDNPEVALRMLADLEKENLVNILVEEQSLIRRTKCFETLSRDHHEQFPI